MRLASPWTCLHVSSTPQIACSPSAWQAPRYLLTAQEMLLQSLHTGVQLVMPHGFAACNSDRPVSYSMLMEYRYVHQSILTCISKSFATSWRLRYSAYTSSFFSAISLRCFACSSAAHSVFIKLIRETRLALPFIYIASACTCQLTSICRYTYAMQCTTLFFCP